MNILDKLTAGGDPGHEHYGKVMAGCDPGHEYYEKVTAGRDPGHENYGKWPLVVIQGVRNMEK